MGDEPEKVILYPDGKRVPLRTWIQRWKRRQRWIERMARLDDSTREVDVDVAEEVGLTDYELHRILEGDDN